VPFLGSLLLASVVVCPAKGATGYFGFLESPPSFVSPYDELPQRPSVALSNRSALLHGYALKRSPKFVRSNFPASSITFNSVYYRKGRIEKTMIPVTVDAPQFLSFRKEKAVDEKLSRLITKSIASPEQGRGRGGLGITVGLPKRLNKVFGEGGAGLRVSGYRRIMFSGRSQWSDAAQSDVYKQSKFPSLSMEQTYRFDINGTIGSKITVKVSEDSQQDIPLANRLIIRYKGDEDDILKSIEAGNTTLSLPRTKFVGYSSNIRGLFGVKSEAQIGRLRLIGIASQEQGSSERMSVTPTGEESAQHTRDYVYAEARIFDLGDSTDFQKGDTVTNLFAYEQVDRLQESEWLPAFLAVDPGNIGSYSAENINLKTTGGVKRIDPVSYSFFSDPVKNQHYIVFNSRRRSNRAIGVYMEIQRVGGTIDTVGHIGDTVLLKLLYHSAPSNQYKTWGLMWRNCYEIPRGVLAEDIDIKVFKGSAGNEGTSSSFEFQESEGKTQRLIEMLGLDQYNELNQKLPDGRFDERLEIFRPDWGLLIFPHRRPFAGETTYVDANGVSTITLLPKTDKIYDYLSDNEKTEASQYYIQLVTKARSSIIRLGKPNIIEGSERVTVNGQPLQRGTGYNILYDLGQITLLSEEANDPNADIDIQFEYAPFMAVQKKTLLGMRAEYTWSKNLEFGSTFLYKSDKAQDRKPRVGQETARAIVYSVDGSWRTQANFLTSLADALPLVETEAASNFRVEGELAQSRPNPNVDNIAYVDDFEAAQEQLSLGTQRTIWKTASWPVQADSSSLERGKILWHAPRNPLDIREVWDVDPKQGEGTIRPLRLIFRPDVNSVQSWGGIMRGFYQRIDAQRVQLLELRAKVNEGARGKLHIDIGRISEDLNSDGVANTEDNVQPNDALEKVEDVGLDGLADSLEPGYDPDTLPDPNGDNWYFMGDGKCPLSQDLCDQLDNEDSPLWDIDSIYYEWLNGTEGNIDDPGWLGIPDKEPLNRMGGQNTNNAYFSYVIDFTFDADSFRVENSERNGWWTYRIPIRDSLVLDTIVTEGGIEPLWNEVSHVRVWFESEAGQTENDTVEIAAWYFVQSNWQDSVLYGDESDSSTNFVVASISEEDQTFSPPPGVEPYQDPNYDVTEAQRGLLLRFEDLDVRDTCLAIKNLISADKYSGYRQLEMYVHGDIEPADEGKVMFFFRLGTTADNFYEQRRSIYPGWDERNYITFDFNDATALKDAALRGRSGTEYKDIDTLSSDSVYRIKGNPNINDVRYFAAGIINTDIAASNDVTGEIWLDELRVTDVRRDVGTAARAAFSGNLADLMSYNFSFESTDAYFRELASATRGGGNNNLGSGKTKTRISYGGSLNLEKFLPRSWGARVPITMSHSKFTETPLLRTNSDIVLPEDVRQEERSVRESNSFSISESFNRKGRNPLFSLLLNRINTSLSYGRNQGRSVPMPYSFSENYSVNSNFNLGISKVPTLPIFFWTKPFPFLKRASGSRLGLYPSTWTMKGSYSRSLSITDDINYNRRSTLRRDFTGSMTLSYKVFENLTTNLKYSTTRDLSDPDQVSVSLKNFRLGLETRYNQSFSTSYAPSVINFLTTSFSYSADYRDDYSRSSQSRHSTMSRRWGVNGRFEHITFLGGGKSTPSGGVPRHRRGGSQGDSDSEKPKSGKPFYDPPLAVLRFLTGWIKPVSYSYSEDYNATLPGMLARPEWKYRYGLIREAGVATVSEGRAPVSGEGQKYSLSSGFALLGGLSIDVKYAQSISRDLVKQGTRYKNVSTSWPGLTIRIQKFRRFPLIKGLINKFIEVFSPRTDYNRETKETYDIGGNFLTSRSVNTNHNPLLSVNLRLLRSLSLSSTYTLTKGETEKYNPTTGAFQSESRTNRRSFAISSQYSFSAPSGISVPLFGKIRFKSTMSISVDVKKSASKSETRRAEGGWVVSADKADFAVTPNISYTFSSQIKGGLRADWRDSYDHFRNRNNHSRMLEIWAEIRF